MEKIVLIGFGGHAKSIVDAIESSGIYEIIGFIDVEEKRDCVFHNYCFVGTDQDAKSIFTSGVKNAFISLGSIDNGMIRNKLYDYYRAIGFSFPRVIDRTAAIAADCRIEEGVFIGKNAVINSNAVLEKLAIINSGAIVEHDVHVGAFSHIAVAAVVCGGCRVGNNCLIGANATVLQQVHIGNKALIGAGAVVTKDVADGKTIVGIPAKPID